MPKRSSPRKLKKRSRRRIQCSRCGNSYSYSGSRSHSCNGEPNREPDTSSDAEIDFNDFDDLSNETSDSDQSEVCSGSDGHENVANFVQTDHDPFLSPDVRKRLRDRLRKRLNEEDMDHFDDDDPDAADSSNDTVDSVNEEWDSEGMPSDPSDPREDFVEPDQSQETQNSASSGQLSENCRVLVYWLLLFIFSWQCGFSVTDSAVDMLVKFLSRFFWIVGTFDENGIVAKISKGFPNTLYKLRKQLGLMDSDDFVKYVVCPKCKTLYNYQDCVERRCGRKVSARCRFIPWSQHPHRNKRGPCDELLLKTVRTGTNTFLYPRMVYPYNSVVKSLQVLLKRPGFWEKCQEWRRQSLPDNVRTDIYQGNVWKELSSSGFLCNINSLAVMLNVDWFRPHKHSPGSVGVIYLVLLNLPRHERYKLENIIVVGVLPGPSEPKLTANTFLEPLVQELKALWACKERFSIYGSLFKRPIKVGLVCVSSDIPATRKIGGFLGHMASQGCSRCKKHFNSGNGLDFSGFDRENWQPRNSSEHKQSAKRTLQETSPASQQKLCSELGARYSVLQELEYFDCIRYFVVDPMHNLYLGTAKHMMKNVWLKERNEFISDEDFERIQELVDSMTVPQDIGRIPGKISCSFSGFTADQWKNWTTVYSLFALKGVLPENHLECWRHFVLACKLLGKKVLTYGDIELGDRHLMEFCRTFEELYGKDLVTPNMHLHGHLKECLLDYGPFHSFWCFSFERFNGILGSFHTNNRSIEIQLMRKFLMQAKVKDFKYPELYQESFTEFFENGQGSGSVKITQEPLEQYLSLQEHREASIKDLSSCDWTANSCISPVSPAKDESLDSDDLNALKVVYQELLGLDARTSIEMPFTISEFKAIKVGSVLYGSQQSQTTRNSYILANWAGTEGSLATSRGSDDQRPGKVITFFRHCIKTKPVSSNSAVQKYEFYFARVNWYSKHPDRYEFGFPLEIWCNTFDLFGPACFIPVQRISSHCISGEIIHKREKVLAVTS